VLLTLNQVISQITTLGAAHLQIQSTGVGDFAEWQAEERSYPLLWVFHESTSVGDRELVYSIRLVCADRVITGEEGDDTAGMEQEVLSDTLLILLDFLAYFQQQHAQSYKVITNASIDPFTERFNDRVAGNSVLIQIRQPFTWDACQIPQTGASIPPSVDGLTLYDFCDPSVIARLTPTQVACLEAEYGITCLDATIELNGVQVATVPSGGTENIVVRNISGVPVGSLDGADWEIANSTVNFNGVAMDSVKAEDAQNYVIRLNGVASGSAFDDHTWDVTSAPCSPVTFQINGVTKETPASGTTFNLITKLDGVVNSGSYDAPTDTLSFTSAVPTAKTTAFLLKTGETVNYGTGSDGQVQSGRGTSWLVMSENNMFGNTNRFTDTLGGSAYANNIVLDHQSRSPLTGQLLGYDKADVVTARTWAAMLTYANTKTVAGYSGWRLTNDRELTNLRREGTNYSWGYAPFNWFGAGVMDYAWTSTTYHLSPANAYLWFNTSTVAQQARDKTGSYFGMFCRTFTLTDGGVLS
jgi:hypothetical protein